MALLRTAALMPPRKKSTVDLRSAAIVSATRLFAAHGAGAVSVQDVADDVGASKQALLYHFKTKDALCDAVLTYVLDEANRGLVDLMGALSGDPSERMGQALDLLEGMLDAQPDAAAVLLRFLLDGQQRASDRIQDGTRPWLAFMVDLIERGKRDGNVRPDLDPEAAVVQVGVLLLTNFALMPHHGWTKSSPKIWRERRLAELVRAIRAILFVDSAFEAATPVKQARNG